MPFADDLQRFGPDSRETVSRDEAMAYCARLTATHYENFSVVTALTPRELRPHFASIYGFCRWSDDLTIPCRGGRAAKWPADAQV